MGRPETRMAPAGLGRHYGGRIDERGRQHLFRTGLKSNYILTDSMRLYRLSFDLTD